MSEIFPLVKRIKSSSDISNIKADNHRQSESNPKVVLWGYAPRLLRSGPWKWVLIGTFASLWKWHPSGHVACLPLLRYATPYKFYEQRLRFANWHRWKRDVMISLECGSGRWGRDCRNRCSCGKGDCDAITGECQCQPGYAGRNCQRSKALHLYNCEMDG